MFNKWQFSQHNFFLYENYFGRVKNRNTRRVRAVTVFHVIAAWPKRKTLEHTCLVHRQSTVHVNNEKRPNRLYGSFIHTFKRPRKNCFSLIGWNFYCFREVTRKPLSKYAVHTWHSNRQTSAFFSAAFAYTRCKTLFDRCDLVQFSTSIHTDWNKLFFFRQHENRMCLALVEVVALCRLRVAYGGYCHRGRLWTNINITEIASFAAVNSIRTRKPWTIFENYFSPHTPTLNARSVLLACTEFLLQIGHDKSTCTRHTVVVVVVLVKWHSLKFWLCHQPSNNSMSWFRALWMTFGLSGELEYTQLPWTLELNGIRTRLAKAMPESRNKSAPC